MRQRGYCLFFRVFSVFRGQKNEVTDKPAARRAGINEGVTLKRNNGMLESWITGRRSPLEGRALSRPATTKRGPPEPLFVFPHHSTIPTFQHSSEVIGKRPARDPGNKLTGNFYQRIKRMERMKMNIEHSTSNVQPEPRTLNPDTM